MKLATHARSRLPELDDLGLLEQIANARNREALAVLYDRYRPSLGGFLRRKLIAEKLVDEVYNDVMYTVWTNATEFRNESKVSTWIFGIAYRICLSQSRKETRHLQHRIDVDFDQEIDPGANTHALELQQVLRRAVAELSAEHRTVVELAYFYGHSIEEIAAIMQCPANTVKTRMFYARQKLKGIVTAHDAIDRTIPLSQNHI